MNKVTLVLTTPRTERHAVFTQELHVMYDEKNKENLIGGRMNEGRTILMQQSFEDEETADAVVQKFYDIQARTTWICRCDPAPMKPEVDTDEAMQRVYDLAKRNASTPEDVEAVKVFHDFVVNNLGED